MQRFFLVCTKKVAAHTQQFWYAYIRHTYAAKAKTTQQWRSKNVAWSLGTPWEHVRCNCGICMAYKVLSLRTYGVLFLSIAYEWRCVLLRCRIICSIAWVPNMSRWRSLGKRHIFSCLFSSFHSHGPVSDSGCCCISGMTAEVPKGLVLWINRSFPSSPCAPWVWLLWRHNAFLVTFLTTLERITTAQHAQELLYAAVYATSMQ